MKPLCVCNDCGFSAAADRALASNDIIEINGYMLVADTVIAAGAARGLTTPPTWRLRRADGRTVSIFKMPDAAA